MQFFELDITTHTNGEKTSLKVKADCTFENGVFNAIYRDNGATVCMQITEKTAKIRRVGDYSLDVTLEKGKRTVSKLGFGSNEGEIATVTDEVSLLARENGVLIFLEYSLDFGREKQNMKLRILAR